MNKASQIIRSHIRDILVLHTSTKKVLITIPLYLEKGLVLDKVGIVGDQIQIEGTLNKLDRQPVSLGLK